MNVLDKLEEIRIALEAEEKRKNRFQGKLDAKMDALQEAGHSSVTKAKSHVKKLEKNLESLVGELDSLVDKFEEDFPQLIKEQ